jgi:hypothetical protein
MFYTASNNNLNHLYQDKTSIFDCYLAGYIGVSSILLDCGLTSSAQSSQGLFLLISILVQLHRGFSKVWIQLHILPTSSK